MPFKNYRWGRPEPPLPFVKLCRRNDRYGGSRLSGPARVPRLARQHVNTLSLTIHERLLILQICKCEYSLHQGAERRGKQRRDLRTKALMRDLGTRLACRHVKNWKNIVEINQELPSRIRTCYPRVNKRTISPLRHHLTMEICRQMFISLLSLHVDPAYLC